MARPALQKQQLAAHRRVRRALRLNRPRHHSQPKASNPHLHPQFSILLWANPCQPPPEQGLATNHNL
jgi:hypothetical protein